MSFPKLPDCMFPQTVIVKISTDIINVGGGANPNPANPGVTFKASVQDKGTAWREDLKASVTTYHVNFQANPDLTLPRAIGPGDEIAWGDKTLSARGPIRDRGGYGFGFRLECEYVKT